jgi:hypothetical protein
MSNNVLKVTKAATLARVQGLILGIQKHFPNGTLTFGNVTHTTATLVQTLQGLADAIAAVNAARVNAKVASAALTTMEPDATPLVGDLTRFIEVTFGNAPQQLSDFGLQPPKARKQLTAEQLAARTAKAKATRQARGTSSKKQKLAVKGNVTGVQITPVTLPTGTGAAMQPAPATPIAAPANPAGPAGTK